MIVQAQPRDRRKFARSLSRSIKTQPVSVAQARIVKLKSANSTELAQCLTQALQSILTGQTAAGLGQTGGGGATVQNAQQLRETKSVVLEFMAQDDMSQELVRSVLLTDVRVNADPRTNSLMISAPKQSMEFMIELVRVLDQPSSAVAEIKVFTLTNADAADAVGRCWKHCFEEEPPGRTPARSVSSSRERPIAGSNLVPIKFSTDGRTNSVVAIGGADALRIVEAVCCGWMTTMPATALPKSSSCGTTPRRDLATSVKHTCSRSATLLRSILIASVARS